MSAVVVKKMQQRALLSAHERCVINWHGCEKRESLFLVISRDMNVDGGSIMSDMNIDKVLMQMRVLAAQAGGASIAQETAASSGVNFSELLGKSVDAVNEAQKLSGDLKSRFEMGDQGVSMVDIAVASEKSRISFTAMTEVRNKLVEAYKDVMSMPV